MRLNFFCPSEEGKKIIRWQKNRSVTTYTILGEFVRGKREFLWVIEKSLAKSNVLFYHAGMMDIGRGIFINEDGFEFRFSRSSGPGGQNVNKVNTRVTLFFDVASCEGLSGFQKKRILEKIYTRADKNGVVRVVSQKHRSQNQNKEAAVERLRELLTGALKRKKVRKKTKVPLATKKKRLEDKKRRGELKKQRKKVNSSEQ